MDTKPPTSTSADASQSAGEVAGEPSSNPGGRTHPKARELTALVISSSTLSEQQPSTVSSSIDQALRNSELSYRRLFEAAQDGILILDADSGRINDANPFLTKLLGFSHAEMVGQTVAELSPFKDIECNEAMLERLQKDGYVRYENLPLETQDGRRVDVEFVSNVYQAGDKKVIQCNIRDITERRRMETALIQFRSIVESSNDAIMGKGLDGIITSWNAGAERIFGYSAGEMLGTSIMRLIPADRRNEEAKILDRIQRGESLDNLETLRQTKDGRLIHVSVTVCPIKDLSGKVIGVSKVAHDITVRKGHEQEIERLSRLYAALSHINQAIVNLPTREELFSKICRVLVEIGKLRMAWVGWLDPKTRQVVPVAQFGDRTNYLSQVAIYADDRPEGQGPTGTAIREERNYLCNNFHHDPHTLPWRESAEQAHFRSSGVFLIRQGGRICGAITVYASEVDFFQDREIALLEEAASDTSFALDNLVREANRRQAEAELRWKTAFLEAQVDSSLDGILVVDELGKKILQNQRMNDLWKIPLEIARHADDRVQVNFVTDRTKNPRQFAEKVAYLYSHPNEVSRDEVELVDGTILDRYSAPVNDQAGKHYGRIWTFRDMTERKRIEARFRRLVDSNAQGVIFWNKQGQITEANDAFLKLMGYTRADLEASPLNWSAMTPPKYADHDQRALKQIAETGVCLPFEKEYIRKDGKQVPVLIGAAAFADSPDEGVCFMLDLTERKALEQQFRQLQKMESIGQLAGGVAHDFNNILAVIQMQTDLLKSDTFSTRQSDLADGITDSIRRGVALTRQLLLFSRRGVFQPSDMDLNETVASTTKMLQRMIGETIEVQLKLAPQPLFLHADAGMLDQVLMNLCVNARDAMPNGGRLIIETSGVELDELAVAQSFQARPGLFVCLSVSDNGSGIPPEILPQIFEPFFTTKVVGKGTGLGLATVFGIVQQHQGWIDVYSEVGLGTAMRIYLPRLDGNVALKTVPPVLPAMRGGQETILLAEDDPDLRVAIRRALSQLGYRILEAPTGIKALEVWQENRHQIRLLLTDMVMPDGMTGRILAQRLLQENPKLEVVYMSGYSAETAGQEFFLEEGGNFLTKPFSAQKLAQIIRDRLDTPLAEFAE